jgi:hypothetical protein
VGASAVKGERLNVVPREREHARKERKGEREPRRALRGLFTSDLWRIVGKCGQLSPKIDKMGYRLQGGGWDKPRRAFRGGREGGERGGGGREREREKLKVVSRKRESGRKRGRERKSEKGRERKMESPLLTPTARRGLPSNRGYVFAGPSVVPGVGCRV